ncbi:hypothetical protein EMIHUDRAFT_248402 [Emiliania huxleyi CCMP1516]|nr:hypothetical protein EMIHUDRAFT_248402 [Emiliania huxleyi CCMP1516]EOD10358.1 hypothetical protein EMIHUDRAFT_248402 [Emiliania huxleyi CCMP1516]|eukprot:XP_005762787.1 hypothetical protein EMIHUDRAFT_248402 [Emiliania huxleyi CCMP1516]
MRGRAAAKGGASSSEYYMEQENDDQIGLLAGKVSALRGIAVQIGDHVREDNKMLDGLDDRLGKLASSKDSRHMLYLALFVVAVILLIYKLR